MSGQLLFCIIEVVCMYNTEQIIWQYAIYMDVLEGFQTSEGTEDCKEKSILQITWPRHSDHLHNAFRNTSR